MFRSHEQQQQHEQSLSDFGVDENYEFTGATLKIEKMDGENGTNNFSSNYDEKPAVLSGTDVVSPIPGSPAITTTGSNYQQSENKSVPPIREDTSPLPNQGAISTIDVTKPKIGSPRHFFCFRKGLFEQAVHDCINILLKPHNDVQLQGSWLLTEISHWDHEKEKIVILTTKTLVVVKFDFIALRILQHSKTPLIKVDTIVKGKLSYPPKSIAPHFEGLANGIASIFHGGLFAKENKSTCTSGFKLAETLSLQNFHPVDRNEMGVRLMWNNGQPLSASTSWNPFASDIPWKTFTNHPLHGYEDHFNTVPSDVDDIDQNKLIYSIDNFHYALANLFTSTNIDSSNVNFNCKFEDTPIVLQNYVGLGAILHNQNNLGFFKVRGKFSF